jgi:hypothetical protein
VPPARCLPDVRLCHGASEPDNRSSGKNVGEAATPLNLGPNQEKPRPPSKAAKDPKGDVLHINWICRTSPLSALLPLQANVQPLVLLDNLVVPLHDLLLHLQNLLAHSLLILVHHLLKRNWIQRHRRLLRDRL